MDNESFKKDTATQKDTLGGSDTNSSYNSSYGLVFKGFSDGTNVIKKTEKIVTAIYLISGLLPENDPLKISLRSQALNFLSFINSIFDPVLSNNVKFVTETASLKIENLLSLINVAFFSGYVSEMNFNIIKNELEWFMSELKNKNFNFVSKLVLSEDFLISKTPVLLHSPDSSVQNVFKNVVNKGLQTYKGHTSIKDKDISVYKRQKTTSNRKLSRRDSILASIKKHGQPTIKDISSDIKDCSEKTIQRELVSLINEGVVKRSGERRWSNYSIV